MDIKNDDFEIEVIVDSKTDEFGSISYKVRFVCLKWLKAEQLTEVQHLIDQYVEASTKRKRGRPPGSTKKILSDRLIQSNIQENEDSSLSYDEQLVKDDVNELTETNDPDNPKTKQVWRSERLKLKENSVNGESCWKCNQCDKYFRTEEMLLAHGLDHDEDMVPVKQRLSVDLFLVTVKDKKPEYMCQLCKKVFKERKDAKAHQKLHNSNNPWYCEYCNKHCIDEIGYKSHLISHVENDVEECRDCGKFFKTSSLKQHRNIYCTRKRKRIIRFDGTPGEQDTFEINSKNDDSMNSKTNCIKKKLLNNGSEKGIYQCSVCSKTFSSFEDCNDHASMHEETIYECHRCNETFNLAEDLEMHYQMSEDCLEIVCTECNVAFNSLAELSLHLQSVANPIDEDGTAVIIYICGYCQKGFHVESTFFDHTHLVENSKTCPVCYQSFDSSVKYNRHLKDVHVGVFSKQCVECDKNFSDEVAMKRHVNTAHGKSRLCRCLPCGKTFTNRDDLRGHMTSQSHLNTITEKAAIGKKSNSNNKLSCSICERVCQTVNELKRHEFAHQKVEMKLDHDLLPGSHSLNEQLTNLGSGNDGQLIFSTNSNSDITYLRNFEDEDCNADQLLPADNLTIDLSDFNIITNDSQCVVTDQEAQQIIAYIDSKKNTPGSAEVLLPQNVMNETTDKANIIQMALNAAVAKAINN